MTIVTLVSSCGNVSRRRHARRRWAGWAPRSDGTYAAAATPSVCALGYPVDSARGVAGGYRLGAGTALPPLLLDDEEATAVVIALRTAAIGGVTGIAETAVSALAKLEQVLPASRAF